MGPLVPPNSDSNIHIIPGGPPVIVHVHAFKGYITKIAMEIHDEPSLHWHIISNTEERNLEKKMNAWIQAYLKGSMVPPIELLFSWPPMGSYTQMVLQTLPAIPFGSTHSYDDVAILTGNTYAARAVGNACRKNPFPLLIPCHRVIGSNGKLVGFSSGGLEVKKALIEYEKNIGKTLHG